MEGGWVMVCEGCGLQESLAHVDDLRGVSIVAEGWGFGGGMMVLVGWGRRGRLR